MSTPTDLPVQTWLGLALDHGPRVAGGIAILAAGWVAARLASRGVRRGLERAGRMDPTLIPVLSELVRYGVVALALIAALAQFGIQTASIIAVLGAAGLAVGLALQGTLSNVAAGIMLLVLKPFSVKDVIEVGGLLAEAEEIGIFMTRLRRMDGIPVCMPNSQIWGQEIKNFTRAQVRRIELTVGISYADDVGKAIRVLKELLEADPRVLAEPEPLVAVGGLGPHSVDLLVWPWTKTPDWWATRLDLLRAIKERFDAEGITIPFPQREVHHHFPGSGRPEPARAPIFGTKGREET